MNTSSTTPPAATTTTTTTSTTPFPPGLIDHLFAQLPPKIRINMILNWAWEFAINGDKHRSNLGLVELIKSITILDFSHYLAINNKMDDHHRHVILHIDKGKYDKSCEYCVNYRNKKGHSNDYYDEDDDGDEHDYDEDCDDGYHNNYVKKDYDDDYSGEPFPHFGHLIHLPFSSSLAHLNLSNTPIGFSSEFMDTLSDPIFKHLVTLNLSDAGLWDLNPFFNAPHQFPNLHTLNLSNNPLSIPQIATTTQFPHLKVLDLKGTRVDGTLEGFPALVDNVPQPPPTTTKTTSAITSLSSSLSTITTTTFSLLSSSPSPPLPLPPQPSQPPQPPLPPLPPLPPFQLEKLVLGEIQDHTTLLALSRSPHVSQLKELHIYPFGLISDIIYQLFDPDRSMLKNLTHLDIGSYLDPLALQALGESPLLSNLISLTLHFRSPPKDLSTDERELRKQLLQQFLHSPFLWTSKLKHLTLHNYPNTFDDFIPTLNAANIKLETLNLTITDSTFDPFLTAPCLSELKEFNLDHWSSVGFHFTPEQFLQLPFLSNLKHFPFPLSNADPSTLLMILSSPKMSNDLIELDFSDCKYPMGDLIQTICTTRVNPDDETSPLKYGKLRKLKFRDAAVTDDDAQLIIENLTELTHLEISFLPNDHDHGLITDKTITTLLATERAEPDHPYATLPNLTHLDLSFSAITCNGLIELSKSQLFSQLEYLDVGGCAAQHWNRDDPELPPGLLALLTNSGISNLKLLRLYGIIPQSTRVEYDKRFQHLDDCQIDLEKAYRV